jgi:hypothetical protein
MIKQNAKREKEREISRLLIQENEIDKKKRNE